LGVATLVAAIPACNKPQKYKSTVEITQTQPFGTDPKAPTVMDLEVVFVDCPGTQRKLLRGDKAFAACALKYKKGDKVPVDILVTYRSDRSEYRDEVVKVGDCVRTIDPKDDASFGVIQECKDVVINGSVSGVHCDRTRGPELVAKCPWFRRK
jgi:hypothetical protein